MYMLRPRGPAVTDEVMDEYEYFVYYFRYGPYK